MWQDNRKEISFAFDCNSVGLFTINLILSNDFSLNELFLDTCHSENDFVWNSWLFVNANILTEDLSTIFFLINETFFVILVLLVEFCTIFNNFACEFERIVSNIDCDWIYWFLLIHNMLAFEDNNKNFLKIRSYIYWCIERKKNKKYKNEREKSFVSKAKRNFRINQFWLRSFLFRIDQLENKSLRTSFYQNKSR